MIRKKSKKATLLIITEPYTCKVVLAQMILMMRTVTFFCSDAHDSADKSLRSFWLKICS